MRCFKKWGLSLLTSAVVLGAMLLPEQISAFRDQRTLPAVHMEPMSEDDLAFQDPPLSKELELLGRAIRYPELDVYSASQPLEDADEQTRVKAERAFLQSVELLAAWGILPQEFDWDTLTVQGGSRAVYVQADGSLSAGILYLQGKTENRDVLWLAIDEDSNLPVWMDCTFRSATEVLGTAEALGQAFWNGLGLKTQQRGPSVWEVEDAGGLVYSASSDRCSGRVCIEPLGFAWDLFGDEASANTADTK